MTQSSVSSNQQGTSLLGNGPNSAGGNNLNYMFVGPYRLEKTLGKGQTGKLDRSLLASPKLVEMC